MKAYPTMRVEDQRTRRDHLDALRIAAPPGTVYLHLAFFARAGDWLAEWAGYAPAFDAPEAVREARLHALTEWQRRVMRELDAYDTVEWACDEAAWRATSEPDRRVVDVTRFEWPVGDHVWHRWDETARSLDWGPEHTFLEVRLDTFEVVANQRSHRPIRSAVHGRAVLDVTGHPIARHYGHIFGRFVRDTGRWMFQPSADAQLVPRHVAAQLEAARIDLEVIPAPVKSPVLA